MSAVITTTIGWRDRTRLENIVEALGLNKKEPGKFLFVSPHDDDAAIGAGATMMLASEAGVEVHVGIVTDGAMGYYSLSEQSTIRDTRRREAVEAYMRLGVRQENIYRMYFPDAGTWQYIGRRASRLGDLPGIQGFTGLENSLTWFLRQVRPSAVITACAKDLHPDHKAVNMELRMSLFHAASGIWPELGEAISQPAFFEWQTYPAKNESPPVSISPDNALRKRKNKALACWASQAEVIEKLTQDQGRAGGAEFLWNPMITG